MLYIVEQCGLNVGKVQLCDKLIGYVHNQTSDESDLLKIVHNQIHTKCSAFVIKSRSAQMHLGKI